MPWCISPRHRRGLKPSDRPRSKRCNGPGAKKVHTSKSALSGGEEQWLNSDNSVESRDGIVSVEMPEDRLISTNGISCYRIRLFAVVQPYQTQADSWLAVTVTGVRGIGSGEPLGFTLVPADSYYVSIFLFNDSGGTARLYPPMSRIDSS